MRGSRSATIPTRIPITGIPDATFFAGAVTGAIWAAAVDWDDWGIWGGGWDGGDIDIDCNNCFNNRDFNGKINFNDVDWKNIDRAKINIDRDQLNKLDRTNIKNRIERNGDNAIRDRARDIKKRDQVANRVPGKTRRNERRAQEHARRAEGPGRSGCKQAGQPAERQPTRRQARRRQPPSRKPAKANRKAGKPKPAARVDNRPKKPSGLGNVDRGKATKVSSNRGHKSMGGGQRGGGGHKQVRRPSGGGGGVTRRRWWRGGGRRR